MDNKARYEKWSEQNFVPVYSKSWWMDAVCGKENWNVWLYTSGDEILAAMPYYYEIRNGYRYITKAPLTQNNGIIFKEIEGKDSTRLVFEEKVIGAACDYIENLGIDVYEQQYQPSFTNWLPFFWNGYQEIVRYTYRFEKHQTQNLNTIWNDMDKKKRMKIKKGQRNCKIREDLSPRIFYSQVVKTFEKQGLNCPFDLKLWLDLYKASVKNNSGKMKYAQDDTGKVASAVFWVWDDRNVYQLISGGDVKLQNLEGKSALVWEGIKMASEMERAYDFEGSVIKRISKSNRLFGGTPVPYFKIRKIFNPDIIRFEASERIKIMNNLSEL